MAENHIQVLKEPHLAADRTLVQQGDGKTSSACPCSGGLLGLMWGLRAGDAENVRPCAWRSSTPGVCALTQEIRRPRGRNEDADQPASGDFMSPPCDPAHRAEPGLPRPRHVGTGDVGAPFLKPRDPQPANPRPLHHLCHRKAAGGVHPAPASRKIQQPGDHRAHDQAAMHKGG